MKLREIRKRKKLTASQLAEMSNVPHYPFINSLVN